MQSILKGTGAYQLLQKEGETEGFSHAYLLLFEDARHLRTAMKVFAKLFFKCDNPTTHAQTRISDLIDGDGFSDCVVFPSEGKKLMVEDAESILEESNLAPVEGEKKLFLIGDFADANVQTQNKLLKLLEEPPKNVHFLLGATSVFPVLPTVLSRTKKLEIFPFSVDEVTAYLRRTYGERYTSDGLTLCAATSGGNLGDACNILEGGYYQELVENAFSLVLAPSYKLPAAIKTAGETAHKKELINLLRLIFRDGLLQKTGTRKTHLLLQSERERIGEVADKYSARALLFAQEALSEAEKQVKFNAIFSQCLEITLANILEKNKECL